MRWHNFSPFMAALVMAAVSLLSPSPAAAQNSISSPYACPAASQTEEPRPTRRPVITILISIDGFRADYIDRGITPTLSSLAADGLRGAMRPSFPSKTFPNHQAIITGLRPDRNGIVGNRMTDPDHPGIRFTLASTEAFWWNEAEPIWAAAEKAGIPTGILFWPGSNVEIAGVRPSNWHQFNGAVTPAQRVDSLLDWVRRPAESRPAFLTLYFDDVDTAGHIYGPDAPETNATIARIDTQIGRLRDGLAAMNQPANLVIVADHGMAAISRDRIIPLHEQLSPDIADVIEEGPYSSINPKPGQEEALTRILLTPRPYMRCYRKGALPARLEYGKNPRVPAFVCLADTGWIIRATPPKDPDVAASHGGNHGWDNMAPEMRAVFIANGPAFMAGKAMADFDNVDVEPMLRQIIGLPAHDEAIDGSAAPFRGLLRLLPASTQPGPGNEQK